MDDKQYRSLTDAVLGAIENMADGWLQSEQADVDSERSGGMLTLRFDNGSQIVVNTQPPLQELWLAARSGGYHFKWLDEQWRDTRDQRLFWQVFMACASEQAGCELEQDA
jgi:CyaY protein